MSCNRHACVTHQKHLEKYNFVRKPQVDDNAPTSSKSLHATIFTKQMDTETCFLKETVICMYRKCFENFQPLPASLKT
ncbi:hypothetical protein RIR_jg34485.t1 [Rhizophagus irregularis DAOM 181602=DAOM 197198]|nr:hypothetical protein RIR_jg34485.t1 [Rhizophagus irregularis DAOM 181602=DAOM 197198]